MVAAMMERVATSTMIVMVGRTQSPFAILTKTSPGVESTCTSMPGRIWRRRRKVSFVDTSAERRVVAAEFRCFPWASLLTARYMVACDGIFGRVAASIFSSSLPTSSIILRVETLALLTRLAMTFWIISTRSASRLPYAVARRSFRASISPAGPNWR